MLTQPTSEIKPTGPSPATEPQEYQTLVNGFRLPPLLAEPDAIWWAKRLAKLPGVWETGAVKAVV